MFNYVREKPMAIAGAVLLAIGQCLLAYSASRAPEAAAAGSATGTAELLQLFVILPVTIAGFSAVNPALQSLLSLNTAADEQGEMLGLGQSISAFARILGPGLGIWLFYRSPQLTYWSAAALMLAAAAWIASLKPAAKPAAAD
jgi:MFS family permease